MMIATGTPLRIDGSYSHCDTASSADFFVVTRKVSDSAALAGLAAGVLLLLCFGVWFGFTLWRRAQERGVPG